MLQEAFFEYAARYLLIPGQLINAADSIKALGIETPLPDEILHILQMTHDIGHRGLVITESDALLLQWNPFSGMTPLVTEYAFGVAGFDDHRWLQNMHSSSVKVLYDQIHESIHAIWAAFGLCGGLRIFESYERGQFHTLAEANAVYVGDIEAHELLKTSGFFDHYWPSGAVRSHAISFSALKGLEAAGLSGDDRLEWIFEVYLDGRRSLPHLPQDSGLKAEALSFLIEEISYSEKIDLQTTPNWLRYYWGRAEIEEYICDFIPPMPFSLPNGEKLDSLSSIRQHWRSIMRGEGWASIVPTHYLQLRLHLQRTALKVCELLGVFESYRLKLEPAITSKAKHMVLETRGFLLDLFNTKLYDLFTSSEYFTIEGSQDQISLIDEQLSLLQMSLSRICGPCLILEHPYLDAIPFGEEIPQLQSYKMGDQRPLADLIQCLKTICAEYKSAYNQLQEIDQYKDIRDQCIEGYLEAHQWLGRLNIDQGSENLLAVQSYLDHIHQTRFLFLIYPLSWMTTAPFIDPLIGFRYR